MSVIKPHILEAAKFLLDLVGKTTPGPWTLKTMTGYYTDQIESAHPDLVEKWPERFVVSAEGPGGYWEANRDLIIFARNGMPILAQALIDAEKQIDSLERMVKSNQNEIDALLTLLEDFRKI